MTYLTCPCETATETGAAFIAHLRAAHPNQASRLIAWLASGLDILSSSSHAPAAGSSIGRQPGSEKP